MENIINCYYGYIFSNEAKFSYLRIVISDSNKLIYKRKSNLYRKDEYVARDIAIKKLFQIIENMENEHKISCKDKVTVFIDDEILYRQFITENGFENVSLHRKDRLKHLSKRLKMHSNWSLSYNPVVNNNLWKLLVGTTADKGCSLRKKQYNTVNNKLLKQKHIRKTSDLIKEGVANIIFFDIEMNCNSDKNNKSGTWEAISLGAVKYNINDNSIDKFYSLIKPKCNTILSDRCIELTSISQTKIDNANNFKVVMLDFEKWIGHEKSMFLSWGVEDIRVIRNDNKKNGLRLEIVNYMRKHFIDFQKEFCSYYLNSKQLISIGNVLAIFDLDFEGSIMHWMMHLIYIEFINIIKVDVKKHTHSLYLYKWGDVICFLLS